MINRMVIKAMRKEAHRIVDAVFSEVGTSFNDSDALYSALLKLGGIYPEELTSEMRKDIMNFGKSMEGVCYLLGLELTFLKGAMITRCAQFTALVDNYLYANGVKPCSEGLKIQYYKQLELYKLYLNHPELFKI